MSSTRALPKSADCHELGTRDEAPFVSCCSPIGRAPIRVTQESGLYAISRKRAAKLARMVVAVAILALAPIVIVASRSAAFPPFGFGAVQRVSLDNATAQLPAGARDPAISGNGRFVAFKSGDVYVRDTIAGTTALISDFGGAGDSGEATISNDGRWVAFTSTNVEPTSAVFVVDRGVPAADGSFPSTPGHPELVSVDATGAPAGGPADSPSISADGSQIVFHFVQGGTDHVAIRDRDRNHNGVITENALDATTIDVTDGPADRDQPRISADGKHVVFRLTALPVV